VEAAPLIKIGMTITIVMETMMIVILPAAAMKADMEMIGDVPVRTMDKVVLTEKAGMIATTTIPGAAIMEIAGSQVMTATIRTTVVATETEAVIVE
jgi:hypothetical protein